MSAVTPEAAFSAATAFSTVFSQFSVRHVGKRPTAAASETTLATAQSFSTTATAFCKPRQFVHNIHTMLLAHDQPVQFSPGHVESFGQSGNRSFTVRLDKE